MLHIRSKAQNSLIKKVIVIDIANYTFKDNSSDENKHKLQKNRIWHYFL